MGPLGGVSDFFSDFFLSAKDTFIYVLLSSHRIELPEEAKYPLHAAETGPLADRVRGVAVIDGLLWRVEAGQALALLQHALVCRLEQAVGHLLGFLVCLLTVWRECTEKGAFRSRVTYTYLIPVVTRG